VSLYVWRLLYPRVVTLGFLEKKGSRKNAPNPRRGLVVFPVPVASAPRSQRPIEIWETTARPVDHPTVR